MAVPNDRELLSCLAHGWTMGEIAAEYGKRPGTLHIFIQRLRKRMGAKTTAHAIHLLPKARFDDHGYLLPMPAAVVAAPAGTSESLPSASFTVDHQPLG